MPIRPAEPIAFPADLFTCSAFSADDQRWWVFQVRPRSEKVFGQLLARSGTAYFLPMCVRKWRSKGRSFQSQLPLFPGYVFVTGEADGLARSSAFATTLVVREIPAPDQQLLGRQLAGVHAVLAGGADPRPETGLATGQPVVLVDGPYAGVEGRFLTTAGELRVLVEISLLGQGVSVAVERWMVRPLEAAIPARSR
jgi:transcription antitermination factor NusG